MPVLDVVTMPDKFMLIPTETEVIVKVVSIEYKSGPYKDQNSKTAKSAKKAGHVQDGKAIWSALQFKFEVVAPVEFEGKELQHMFFVGSKNNNKVIDQVYYSAGLPTNSYEVNPLDTDVVVSDLTGRELGLKLWQQERTTDGEDELGNPISTTRTYNIIAREDPEKKWSELCIYRPVDVDVERETDEE